MPALRRDVGCQHTLQDRRCPPVSGLRRGDAAMSRASSYPWNVRIDVGGVTFDGPGMEGEMEAEAIKNVVKDKDCVQKVEVYRQ